MDRHDAKITAMAYAWGREDGSGELTVTPDKDTGGIWAFSEAYAQGRDDYDSSRRHSMIDVKSAWEHWQASGGRAVFDRGDLTLDDEARAELNALWGAWVASDESRAAYYARKTELQDAAWAALGQQEATA